MTKKLYLYTTLLFAAFTLASCDSSPEDEAEKQVEEEHGGSNIVALSVEQVELMKIETAEPERRQLTGYITAPAKIAAIPTKIADIGTLISGRVTKIYVHEGDHVKAGQALLEIQGLEIGEIKGEFIRTQAALKSAEANFKRQEKLRQENIAAEKAYIEAKSAYAEAKAAFSAADQKLHSIGITDAEALDLIKLASQTGSHNSTSPSATLEIHSPIAGVVSRFQVKIGQLVDPDTEVMEVLNSDEVWVIGEIYEKDLDSIELGQRVEVESQTLPDIVSGGKIEYISPVVEKETRTIKVRSTLQNQEGWLKPNSFVTLRIFRDQAKPSLVVPLDAVQNDGETDFVFLLEDGHETAEGDGAEDHADAGSRFVKIPVRTGLQQGKMIEIVAGLNGNERIVIEGAFLLKSELLKESFGGGHGH
ncbi:MAG: efflux RND transporter periplasmic adaptor subunit [bacterium]